MSYEVEEGQINGIESIVGLSPEGLRVEYVPGAGMVCASIKHLGEEILGQRGGLAAYMAQGKTFGIPFLFPWANRLGSLEGTIDGRTFRFPKADPNMHYDAAGLPMHGLLAAAKGWKVVETHATEDQFGFRSEFEFDKPEFIELFPFPATISMDVTLKGTRLEIVTTLKATHGSVVPIAFGYHPYLQLPNVERSKWKTHFGVCEQALLNESQVPTGETVAVSFADSNLGDRRFDDLFSKFTPDRTMWVQGGGRRITVEMGMGVNYCQIFAPIEDAVIAFEPMSAPSDPYGGAFPLKLIQPTQAYQMRFAIEVVPIDA